MPDRTCPQGHSRLAPARVLLPAWTARRPAVALVTLLLALLAAPARAGNPVRPRTPVVHLDETCLVTLDRAVTPTAALTYTIPHEDTCDVPHGAPTQQFFALCRGLAPGEALPQWLSEGDLLAGLNSGALLPPVAPADLLPLDPEWSGCVTPLADPRPIACEAARAPVVWDLHDMSPGTYAVAAYTFHPPVNLWTPRWGLLRIVDSATGELPPAAAFANREAFVYADQILDLELCVGAEPGATVDLAYALHAAPDTWVSITRDVAVTGEHLHVPWDPPPELAATELRLRVDIRDPAGRSATAVAPELIHVLAVPGHGPAPTVPDPAPDICRPPGQELPALDCPSSTSPNGQAPEDMLSETACDLAGARPPVLLALLLLLPRRRKCARKFFDDPRPVRGLSRS